MTVHPQTWRASRRAIRPLVTAAAVCLLLVPAAAPFSGSLMSTLGGVVGTGNWIVTGPTTISWNVFQNLDLSWHYAYDFSHPVGETSHFILETSLSFTDDDLWNAAGDFETIDVGLHAAGPANPSIPEALYGIKFDSAEGLASHFEFDSGRAPIWGDFYAKDGNAGGHGANTAWNAGFTAGDTDPVAALVNGSVQNHLLVPDTDGVPTTPEPSTLLLMGSGLAGLLALRRRRS